MKKIFLAFLSVLLCISMLGPVSVMAAENDIVYVTNTGDKYHRANCSYLRRSKRQITLGEAQRSGYKPCSKCFGGTVSSAGSASTVPTNVAAAAAPVAGVTAEQAVQNAYALYVQNGLSSDAAMARIQAVLAKLTAQPAAYVQIVQDDLAALNQSGAGNAASAEQLVQQMYAALIAQGMSSDQAMAQVQASLPAILAQAR